jgi:hypothetical protein
MKKNEWETFLLYILYLVGRQHLGGSVAIFTPAHPLMARSLSSLCLALSGQTVRVTTSLLAAMTFDFHYTLSSISCLLCLSNDAEFIMKEFSVHTCFFATKRTAHISILFILLALMIVLVSGWSINYQVFNIRMRSPSWSC